MDRQMNRQRKIDDELNVGVNRFCFNSNPIISRLISRFNDFFGGGWYDFIGISRHQVRFLGKRNRDIIKESIAGRKCESICGNDSPYLALVTSIRFIFHIYFLPLNFRISQRVPLLNHPVIPHPGNVPFKNFIPPPPSPLSLSFFRKKKRRRKAIDLKKRKKLFFKKVCVYRDIYENNEKVGIISGGEFHWKI